IEIPTVPQLEDEQLPEAQRVGAFAGQVFAQQPRHERRLEIAALSGAGRGEHVGEEIRQSAAEPRSGRGPSSLFPSAPSAGRGTLSGSSVRSVYLSRFFSLRLRICSFAGSVAAKSMASL